MMMTDGLSSLLSMSCQKTHEQASNQLTQNLSRVQISPFDFTISRQRISHRVDSNLMLATAFVLASPVHSRRLQDVHVYKAGFSPSSYAWSVVLQNFCRETRQSVFRMLSTPTCGRALNVQLVFVLSCHMRSHESKWWRLVVPI